MKDNLFTDFKAQTEEEWRAKIEADLKGKSLDELNHIDDDGIVRQPNYFALSKETPALKYCSDIKKLNEINNNIIK